MAQSIIIDKLIVIKLAKKFPACYGARSFITVFIRADTYPYPEPAETGLQGSIL